MSATAFAGVGLLFMGIWPPLLNHFKSDSKFAVPLPMMPRDFIALHMLEALLNEGLTAPPWQPELTQLPGVPVPK
jgi:hypothetical protein